MCFKKNAAERQRKKKDVGDGEKYKLKNHIPED